MTQFLFPYLIKKTLIRIVTSTRHDVFLLLIVFEMQIQKSIQSYCVLHYNVTLDKTCFYNQFIYWQHQINSVYNKDNVSLSINPQTRWTKTLFTLWNERNLRKSSRGTMCLRQTDRRAADVWTEEHHTASCRRINRATHRTTKNIMKSTCFLNEFILCFYLLHMVSNKAWPTFLDSLRSEVMSRVEKLFNSFPLILSGFLRLLTYSYSKKLWRSSSLMVNHCWRLL